MRSGGGQGASAKADRAGGPSGPEPLRVSAKGAHPLRERVSTLFAAIAHGDAEHRAWLEEAINAHFAGSPIPVVRGTGNKEARIAELERQLAAKGSA